MSKKTIQSVALLALAVFATLESFALAQQVPPAAAAMGATPPAASESALEMENKAVVVTWFKMCFEQGKAAEAFPLYVSKNFVEHSRRGRGGYESAMKMLVAMSAGGGRGDLEVKAGVNDEMVTIQSKIGIEVLRVVDGKITDHWEGNP